VRLNTFEFAGMLGVMGGLMAVSVLPGRFSWNVSLLIASTPVLAALALAPALRGRFPDRPRRPRDVAAKRGTSSSFRVGTGPAEPIVWMMFAVGVVMALSWSSVSQFLIPLRGTREFGLDRAGVSRLLAMSQFVDLLVLLPVGWLADRLGRVPVMAVV